MIGDAAGHNDPTIGQGLSITMRDVRLVAETLAGTAEWGDGLFASYSAERRERMRRLRFTARLWSKLRCEFDSDARQRRVELGRRLSGRPAAGLPLLTPLIGPIEQSDDAFGEAAVSNLLGEEWCLTNDGWFERTDEREGTGGRAARQTPPQ
jgi:hypothetical protein